MNTRQRSVFLCSGEPSGDLYVSFYVKQILRQDGYCLFYGTGGREMRSAGVTVLLDPNEFNVFGLHSAIGSLSSQLMLLRKIKRIINRIRPELFVAVAYPGLNLLLAQYAGEIGCKVQYLMPPQAWAWGGFRANLVRRWVDQVITVFPFEFDYYRCKNIPVRLWENPLQDYAQRFLRTDYASRVGFMPGSRTGMVQRNLRVIVGFLTSIGERGEYPNISVIFHDRDIIEHNKKVRHCVEKLSQLLGHRFSLCTDTRYQAMKNCDVLVTCSGTASLESAFMNIPQVFFHHCTPLDFYIFKRFLKIHEYNLANLYFGKTIVPSCVTYSCRKIVDFLHVELAQRNFQLTSSRSHV